MEGTLVPHLPHRTAWVTRSSPSLRYASIAASTSDKMDPAEVVCPGQHTGGWGGEEGRERQLCIAYMYSLNLDVHTHMPACSLIGGTVHIYAVLEYQV